ETDNLISRVDPVTAAAGATWLGCLRTASGAANRSLEDASLALSLLEAERAGPNALGWLG
ncbi:MAG TPA: hypothetical protein VFQ80_17770, partial [Thermomicrobiales bacterium]|nr:hypothetical protein [Thermomicrobiales bacterium]